MNPALAHPEAIHPSLWKASQLPRSSSRGIDTGHPALTAELPGGGWPAGALVELLAQQAGIGELRLLAPMLARAAGKPVVLIQSPHVLQPLALAYWGVDPSGFVTLPAPRTADALWAAEQALRAGTCAAVLLWQAQVRTDALRRLNLAAQSGAALFFLFRPTAAARDASPAPLRLSLAPKRDGIDVTFVKRRGPARDTPLFVPLSPSPILLNRHASLDRRASAAPQPRSVPATIAGAVA
ncbi:cell division protein [Burkholderia multivorans]|uniref:translesion DNA synthesis-associated protein ImuA n=1 Tax=Burkholderia cepacia complex TaxID=87882 RepID=UPI000757D82D|nr:MULTISPECIES: translesion DNA synthesis-associated protein ImuA [Burkholderia cepacia complex]KVV21664.1 cell division protein [Burkholderia multivorans]MCA7888653.1 translesion DNA synthesis-associated protein ImuA [Burkholderia contaminans]MDN7577219.1 translesion DNA synthesis-associated protein ImuA [Burkholderia contaminans]PRF33394.1 translesion DNA synthesis-associated protein ImuA [Burkholderia multivorans]